MGTLWPWFAVAGLGLLHGTNPASGWMFVAAAGAEAPDRAPVRRALLPIGVGHVASVAIVAWAVVRGWSIDREHIRSVAGTLLVAAAAVRCLRGTPPSTPAVARGHPRTGRAGLALWSFAASTIHGSGSMLVPALLPLCAAGGAARAMSPDGPLLLPIVAVGVHTAAMLAATAAVAGVARRSLARYRRLSGGAAGTAWTAALGITGALLIAIR